MYDKTTRECTLMGDIIALVQIGKNLDAHRRVVKVQVEVPATYTSDWQEDGGYYHDEGWYDFDFKDAKLVDKYYEDIYPFGFKEGRWGDIEKIIEVFSDNLEEVA